MFGFGKKKAPVAADDYTIRDTLFGDAPLDKWPPSAAGEEEPWASFVTAREQLAAGNAPQAIEHWRWVLAMPNLESRHYLQAWQFLRALGIQPDDSEAKRVYGVILEVALLQGLDIVTAYADGHARYFNCSGSGVVWERPNNSLDVPINALLSAGQTTANQIGPWTGARPLAPKRGDMRLSMLTPSGLHFGQGPMDVLANDGLAKPVFDAATQLMLALIEKQEQAKAQ